jgi:4-hydroxybenzoate polyprenyltransferase
LTLRFGRDGFDVAASYPLDQHLRKCARNAVVVAPVPVRSLSTWLHALRLHQWSKNLLVFVPAVVSHRIAELPVLGSAALAFLCFGLCASATYLINDLLDLEADRDHPRKRARPLAWRAAIGNGC